MIKGRLRHKVSAILFRIQFCGSRPDKITHPHVQRSDGGHDPFSGDRNHEYNESGNNHLYCLSSGGQSHQIRQDSHQKEQSGKDIEDCGRESNDKGSKPLDHSHDQHDRKDHHLQKKPDNPHIATASFSSFAAFALRTTSLASYPSIPSGISASVLVTSRIS